MSVSPRLIRSRIKSVSNTKKITKAMELVSAAKMRRAVMLATAARRYAILGAGLLKNLSVLGSMVDHPFFRTETAAQKALFIVIGSDRGLCGAYNVSLMRVVDVALAKHQHADFIVAGRHAELALRRAGRNIIASFPGLTNAPRAASVRPLITLAESEFTAGVYGAVYIASTAYVSALRQTPEVKALLPLAAEHPLPNLLPVRGEGEKTNDVSSTLSADTIFEPSPADVLEYTLPRFLEATVYQAVLEAAASEHSARMMSMRNASEAASDMITDYTFTLNQARQSAITSEIAEISAGRAALEG
jgi:F-type H+-transporting ATPase subunit gamma